MPQLVNDHVISIFANNSCPANKHVHHIANEQEVLNLVSSLTTLGYIEFDVLCNLDSLEAKLYGVSDVPCSSRNTFHAIGKYNSRGEYLVHKLYICSDMRLSFMVFKCDQLMSCMKANYIMPSFSIFDSKLQVRF